MRLEVSACSTAGTGMYRQHTGARYAVMVSKPPRPPSWRDFETPEPTYKQQVSKSPPKASAMAPAVAAAGRGSARRGASTRQHHDSAPGLRRLQHKSYSEGSDLSRVGTSGGARDNIHPHTGEMHSHTLPNPHKAGSRRLSRGGGGGLAGPGRLHRTRSQYLDQGEFPRPEHMTVNLGETRAQDFGIMRKSDIFDPRIYMDENAKRCERWLKQVHASQPLDVDFSGKSGSGGVNQQIPEEEQPRSGSGSEVDSVSTCAAHRADLSAREREEHVRLPTHTPRTPPSTQGYKYYGSSMYNLNTEFPDTHHSTETLTPAGIGSNSKDLVQNSSYPIYPMFPTEDSAVESKDRSAQVHDCGGGKNHEDSAKQRDSSHLLPSDNRSNVSQVSAQKSAIPLRVPKTLTMQKVAGAQTDQSAKPAAHGGTADRRSRAGPNDHSVRPSGLSDQPPRKSVPYKPVYTGSKLKLKRLLGVSLEVLNLQGIDRNESTAQARAEVGTHHLSSPSLSHLHPRDSHLRHELVDEGSRDRNSSCSPRMRSRSKENHSPPTEREGRKGGDKGARKKSLAHVQNDDTDNIQLKFDL